MVYLDKSPNYAELHCLSNFSFLRGASHPEELVQQAAALRYKALALTDECTLAGVVRAHQLAKQLNFHLIIGSEIYLSNGICLVLLARNRQGYGQLSQLISFARRQAVKGEYHLTPEQFVERLPMECFILWVPNITKYSENTESHENPDGNVLDEIEKTILWLKKHCGDALRIAAQLHLSANDPLWIKQLQHWSASHQLSICATGNVLMHISQLRKLQDVLTAVRLKTPLTELGYNFSPNAERYLRTRTLLAKVYPASWLAESAAIAALCNFSLDELRYEYPRELVPENHSGASWLRHLSEAGLKNRWPQGAPDKVRHQLEYELCLIAELQYEAYFLTVEDIVSFARHQGILCQGRGSAANSVVCYCLGITEVDPARMNLLFERFMSRERNEPPDIDVDFEHERREEVIQYIYRKYGRDRAALAATVITYQPRSAIRDVGKALGFSLAQVDRLAKAHQWWDGKTLRFDPEDTYFSGENNPRLLLLVELVTQIVGFPRHLSQHVGGFVIAADDITRLVPVENAAMPERTLIQWDKNDLDALGLLKVDVLALGMLTAIRKSLQLINSYTQQELQMADIPAEDPVVYNMLQKADTIGVFQIESRAQMSMLPRLKPKNYYDLVIEIAIVRPGPIQGDMVHPYLARRNGREVVTYPSEAVRGVLERTLGVPIFQEQVMQLAMVAAGFSAGEADQLRRSMAAWQRRGGLEQYEEKLQTGMTSRGYTPQFAKQIFRQILGFGEYGFPESHAASFALLAYVSAWLKMHHPAAFACALLNSQPMGFYAPAQLIQDARHHGVKVLPVDVCTSNYDCSLEFLQNSFVGSQPQKPALRLGLRLVKGLSQQGAQTLVKVRHKQAFSSAQDLAQRCGLNRIDMEALAAADALASLEGHRHRSFWQVSGLESNLPLFGVPHFQEAEPMLPVATMEANVIADYATTGLSLRKHPIALIREKLAQKNVYSAQSLSDCFDGQRIKVAGLVINRQRPGTASGVIFMTLEDETGYINIIVWPQYAHAQRKPLLTAHLLQVDGHLQAQDGVIYVIAGRLTDISSWVYDLKTKSRDFH